MGERPLRQYYDGVAVVVDEDFGPVAEPWLQHRRRLTDELSGLTEAQWKAPTRCTGWDARGVVAHLVTVDSFFTLVLSAAHAGNPPTSFIRGFDPSTGTDELVAPLLDLPVDALLDRFAAGTESLTATVESLGGEDWEALGEAPFGHLPARLILAHAFWDSWLHERDILEPLGVDVVVDDDELLVATWYSFVMAGLQGGLVGDPEPVGPVAGAPIDVTLEFDDLAVGPVRVEIDSGTRVSRADGANAVSAGSAVQLVEVLTGRAPMEALHPLPNDLSDQLRRAALIL
jgi:uncharacterized protein (TIGR03083 family)